MKLKQILTVQEMLKVLSWYLVTCGEVDLVINKSNETIIGNTNTWQQNYCGEMITVKDALPEHFMSELLTSDILTIFKQWNTFP